MTATRRHSRLAPWWSPWGVALRLAETIREPGDLVWFARVGWFVARLPQSVARTHVTELLERLSSAPRPRARDPVAAAARVERLRDPWLKLPGLRSRATCYVRALTLYRFLDGAGHDVALRVGAEWHDRPGGVLRGHAWVELDGRVLEGPPEADAHDRLQLIVLTPRSTQS